VDGPEHYLDDSPADRLEHNLPQGLADNLDHRLENHSADYSADCPENHLEDNPESNPADNLPDYSADCLVNRLPDYLDNYLVNYRPSAVFSSLSAAPLHLDVECASYLLGNGGRTRSHQCHAHSCPVIHTWAASLRFGFADSEYSLAVAAIAVLKKESDERRL
jgi:hypothetical protein